LTRQRYDSHSTEFGLWLRQQAEIDSSLGFVTTNVDYIWENYKTGEWMLIEEKRFMGVLSFSQKNQFNRLYKHINKDSKFKGFHLLQFENTNPDDGKVFLDHKEINKQELLDFLSFKRG